MDWKLVSYSLRGDAPTAPRYQGPRSIGHVEEQANDMVRRNVAPARANLFDDNQRPTWLVAEDSWRKILDLRALPVGTDLVRVLIVELLNYHDAGWRLREFNA